MSSGQQQVAEVKQLLESLETYEPSVPDELTDSVLRQCGYGETDRCTTRLVSLATQRFLSNVVFDALQKAKARASAPKRVQKEMGLNPSDPRLILTTEELTEALHEYGIRHKPVPYLVDTNPPPQQS